MADTKNRDPKKPKSNVIPINPPKQARRVGEFAKFKGIFSELERLGGAGITPEDVLVSAAYKKQLPLSAYGGIPIAAPMNARLEMLLEAFPGEKENQEKNGNAQRIEEIENFNSETEGFFRQLEYLEGMGLSTEDVLSVIASRCGLEATQCQFNEPMQEQPARGQTDALPAEVEASARENKTVTSGTLSNMKGWALGNVQGFSEKPLRFLFVKSVLNKWAYAALALYASAHGGVELYSNPAKRTTYQFFANAWDGISNAATAAAQGISNNAATAAMVAGGALFASMFLRKTPAQKFSRISYSSAVLSAPFIAEDLAANADAGLRGLDNMLDLSTTSNTLGGIALASFVLSRFIPNKPHDEVALTANQGEKEPSLFSRISTGFWWGVYNGIGAVLSAPFKLVSKIRKIGAAKKAAKAEAPAPSATQTMPVEMMPEPKDAPGEAPMEEEPVKEPGYGTGLRHPDNPGFAESVHEEIPAREDVQYEEQVVVPLDDEDDGGDNPPGAA